MGARKKPGQAAASQLGRFVAPSAAVDPALASLFASSLGPLKIPEKSTRKSKGQGVGDQKATTDGKSLTAFNHHDMSSSPSTPSSSEAVNIVTLKEKDGTPPRKRQKLRGDDDIEGTYMDKLLREDARDATKKKLSVTKEQESIEAGKEPGAKSSRGSEDVRDSDLDKSPTGDRLEDDLPQHESLASKDVSLKSDKVNRTVFLGNVSTNAIKSKSAKNELLEHLRIAVKELPEHKPPHGVESLRFRSTAFVSGAGPKKAAFAKGELMDQTTKSTNAYVVYSTELAAQRAVPKLNGSVILDRHLRADSLASPTKIEHRRCVFVGNLNFVDEETQDVENVDGSERRRKANLPADAEEGLWRVFGKAGRVESVRVVRDKETRIGKGFAYVQFFEENAVEAALLMNDKKYPPMLPRKLRVMRAKRTKQKAVGHENASMSVGKRSMEKRFSEQDRRSRGESRPTGRARAKRRTNEGVIFEGHRASKSRRESDIASKHRKRHSSKASSSSLKRAAAFKAAGAKRGKRSS